MKPPLCRAPDHPPERSRDSMVLVEEHRTKGYVTHLVFACVACRDIRKILSVQVRALPEFRQAIREHPDIQRYKRARSVERDPTSGKITYFR